MQADTVHGHGHGHYIGLFAIFEKGYFAADQVYVLLWDQFRKAGQYYMCPKKE